MEKTIVVPPLLVVQLLVKKINTTVWLIVDFTLQACGIPFNYFCHSDLSALPVSVGDVLSPPYISMQVMYMGTYICMGITFMQMVIWLLRSRCRQESVLQNPFLKPCVNYIGTVSYILGIRDF